MFFFFQGEDGIRGSVASRGLGDVYKGPFMYLFAEASQGDDTDVQEAECVTLDPCPLNTSDAADE